MDRQTDGHGYIHLARRSNQEYVYLMVVVWPPSMRYKLRDKILILYW